MSVDYIASNTTDGLTLKLYRGEDMVLLAFDIDDSLKQPDFVGSPSSISSAIRRSRAMFSTS